MSNASRALAGAMVAVAACLPLQSPAQTPAPAQPTVVLPPLQVTGQEGERDQIGPVRGYQALTTTSATRTDTPLREIPQSITVLPRRLLEEQGSTTLEEALRNAPAVVPESPLFLNQTLNTLVRGFPAEIYRDGLPSFSEFGLAQSLLGVERIEILKGPSGTLFGGGLGAGHGGAVNIVTRLPAPPSSYEMGVRIGPRGYLNPFVDLNQRLGTVGTNGPEVTVRLQAERLHSRSYIEGVTTDGYNVQPSITIRDDRTKLSVVAFFSERRANDYPGLPPELLQGSGFAFDRLVNANGGNVPRTVTRRSGARMLFEHRFDDVFTLRLNGQLLSNTVDQPSQFQFGPSAASLGYPVSASTYGRYNGRLVQDLMQYTVQPSVEARFTTGPVRHTVLVGGEYDHTTDNGAIGFALADLFDFAAPASTPFVSPAIPPISFNTYQTVAGYVQEQATLWDRVHLLGALRLTNIDIKSTTAGITGTANRTRLSPRVGLTVEVLPGLSPFVGWGTGIRAPSGYGLGGFVTTPKPEESDQFEAGVKFDLPFGVSGSLAWFNITRNNVPYFDLLAGGNRQIGEQQSRGVDIDLLWQPTPNISVLGSYAHTVAETVKDSTIPKGTPLRLVPRDAARVWASYRFTGIGPEWLHGLTLGAGATAVAGATTSDTAAPISTKGYTIFDAQVSYQLGAVRLALTGRNLADRRYVIPFSYFNNSVAPGSPREVYLTASVRF